MISPKSRFSDPRHELWTLLESLCEDRLSEAETERLEALVLTDASARRIYRDYIELHGSLYWDTALAGESTPIPAEGNGKPAAIAPSTSSSRRRLFQAKQSLLALAVLLFAGLGLWWSGVFRIETADSHLANKTNSSKPLPPPKEQPEQKHSPKNVLPLVAVKKTDSLNEDPWPAIAEHSPRGAPRPSAPNGSPHRVGPNVGVEKPKPRHGSEAAVVAAVNSYSNTAGRRPNLRRRPLPTMPSGSAGCISIWSATSRPRMWWRISSRTPVRTSGRS